MGIHLCLITQSLFAGAVVYGKYQSNKQVTVFPLNSLASPSVVFLRTELRKRISNRHQKDEVYLWNPFTVQYFVYDQSPWAACENQFPWIFKWHFYQAYQNNILWYFKDLQGHLWAILKFISVKQSTFLVSSKQCLWLVSVTKLEKNWNCGVLKQGRLTTPATCDRKPNTFAICSFLTSCFSTLLCSSYSAEKPQVFLWCAMIHLWTEAQDESISSANTSIYLSYADVPLK